MPKLHLYFHTPVPVFKARVNMPSVTYPVSSITFDGVTLGSYTDIQFDSTILLGTTEGADDLGRTRVQKPASSISIPIMRSSQGFEDGQVDVVDNAYITVLDDFRVWARLPYYDLVNGFDYKDGDVEVGDYNVDLPPIANCGSYVADYIDPDTGFITVQFPNNGVNLSRAMADGATIASYDWDVKDGTITVGTSSDAVITATFPAGFRYVAHTVVDSNGEPHTSRCAVLAIDPANDTTIKNYQISQRLEWKGSTLDVNIHDEMSRADYPDGTLVLFWWDAPVNPGDREHMKFVGWVSNESYNISRTKPGLKRSATLHCVDVCGRLAVLPGFPQAISRIEDESPWSYMPSLDMNKSLWYLGFWHSTAINLADFILPEDGDDYDAMRLDASGASLFEQMSSQAQKMVPDHYLTCNAKGQMVFKRDWRLDDVGDRPTSAPIITEDYWNDIQVEYNRHPKVYVLRSGAILSSTELDENDEIPLVFSIAPDNSEAFGQGVQEQIENEGLALSQGALNKSEGHRYAMLNSRYGDFTLRDPSGFSFWDYEPAAFNRVQLNIPANLAAQRGLDFTQASGLVKNITVQYQTDKRGTVVKPSVVWNKETSGYPALTHIPEEVEDVGYVTPPPYVPDFGLIEGQELVAVIGSWITNGESENATLIRTFDFQTPEGSGGPTWEGKPLGITDNVCLSFVVDPFSPGYINQNGTGAINGWMAGEDAIWRIEDMFGTTPTATKVYDFPVSFASTSNIGSREGRVIQASFGDYFAGAYPWLMVISHYANKPGHTGTWATYSVDGGVTWNEVQITPFYDSATGGPRTDIDVYLSPKTPGYAIASAYTATGSPAPTAGYVTTDWGATWSIMQESEDSISDPLPMFAYWTAAPSTTLIGLQAQASMVVSLLDTNPSDGTQGAERYLIIAPPPDTARMEYTVEWFAIRDRTGSSSSSINFQVQKHSFVGQTGSLGFTQPAQGSSNNGSADITLTYTFGDWPINRNSIVSSPPTAVSQIGCRVWISLLANAVGAGNMAMAEVAVRVTVTEIELDGGHIYTPALPAATLLDPGNRPANSIHIPWMNNDDELIAYSSKTIRGATFNYALMKAMGDGATINDISPVDSALDFGPRRSSWGVRVYDSDPNYVAVAGGTNDVSASVGDDAFAIFVSDDAGATWAKITDVFDESDFPLARGFRLAFAGDNPNVLYLWGQGSSTGTKFYIAYTDDFGATIDDRSGNIGSVGGSGGSVIDSIIGIAGGPTGG